jgi:hypothetical protein
VLTETRKVLQPKAAWATTLCPYAVKKGRLQMWHDCAQQATYELDGQLYCYEHWNDLKMATS